MRITDSILAGLRIDRATDTERAPAPAARSESALPPDSSDTASAQQLAALVSTVVATDEVRPELVREVARRLAAGEYETPGAAARTADAILRATN